MLTRDVSLTLRDRRLKLFTENSLLSILFAKYFFTFANTAAQAELDIFIWLGPQTRRALRIFFGRGLYIFLFSTPLHNYQ